jgi:hypothetical protein
MEEKIAQILIDENNSCMVPDEDGWFTADLPQLYPLTATLDGLKHFYPNLDMDGISFVKVKITFLTE